MLKWHKGCIFCRGSCVLPVCHPQDLELADPDFRDSYVECFDCGKFFYDLPF